MKEYALELVNKREGFNAKLNIMREYLQVYILKVMHDGGMFRSAAFLGGTALRFLYDLRRFSEDLDFSLTEGAQYKFEGMLKKIEQELLLAGYDVALKYKVEKTVQGAFIKFSGLMYEAGLSPLKDQKFSIKVEIDTNPPKGAVLTTHIVNKYFPISFLSYDIPSLFAGKLGAVLTRKYTKGRDLFDLLWYLSRRKDIAPNITLLNNGLRQTGWKGEALNSNNWRDFILEAVKKMDWERVREDVENFLEDPSDLKIFTKENVMQLLKGPDV